MKTIQTILLTLTIAASAATQPVPEADPPFTHFDKDNDGKVTAAELGMPAAFKAADKNGDGFVTQDEFAAHLRQRRGHAPRPKGAGANAQTEPSSIRFKFTPDYVPGKNDVSGQWMGGTEALNLAVHKGHLYAGIGYWQDIPLYEDKPGDPWVGAQILVKQGKDTPWKVDLNMGQRVLRARALRTVTFETDAQGNRLPHPVEMLLTSGMNFGSPEILVWSRVDDANQWHKVVVDRTKVGDYLVALGSHRDQVTGVSHVFGGSRNGSVYKGVFDPAAPGKIRWEDQPEFTTRDERADTKNAERRVMGFAEADGALYASIRTSIYRRADGAKPDWQEVYRWPLPPADQEGWRRPEGRGLTAVPKPNGKGEMLLVALEMEQVIRRIDPANGHRAEDDFNVGAYFLKAWGHEIRSSLCMAHNRMVPYTIPATGENLLMFGFIANPRGARSWNRSGGAGLFVRRADGTYHHFPVEDPRLDPHPVLYATRDIAPSPWEPNVIYVCGYDATGNAALKTRALNTAWIWRGEFQQNKSKD
jgi:hypothetical protein